MLIYDNEYETKENKSWTKDKLNYNMNNTYAYNRKTLKWVRLGEGATSVLRPKDVIVDFIDGDS